MLKFHRFVLERNKHQRKVSKVLAVTLLVFILFNGVNLPTTRTHIPLSSQEPTKSIFSRDHGEIKAIASPSSKEKVEVVPQQDSSQGSSELINGSFKGFHYQYGNVTEQYQGSFNQTSSVVINETYSNSEITTQSLYLIENWTLNDIYYKITIVLHNMTSNQNVTRVKILDNDTFRAVIFPIILDGLVNGTDQHFQEDYSTDWAIIIDQNDSPLLQVPVNVSYFHFIKNNMSWNIFWQPLAIQVILGLKLYQDLQVNTTELFFVIALINNTYQLTYDVNITSVLVNIWHDRSLFLQVMGAGHYRFHYTELAITLMFYQIWAIRIQQLKFANGTDVPPEMYPFEFYPMRYTQQGINIEISYQEGLFRGASIQQSILQSYFIPNSTLNNDTNDTNQNNGTSNTFNSSRLALWLLQTVPTFIGFKDNNHNGILDLQFSVAESISIGSNDVPILFGNAEAQEKSIVRFRQVYQKYNASFEMLFLNINQSVENKEINETFFEVDVEAIGNVDAFPRPQLVWHDPQEIANGTYLFNFSILYDDVPVTWYRIDGSNTTTTMDVGYDYAYIVNPSDKQASLSPTFHYGPVALPLFSQPQSNVSLVIPVLSEFLFLTPVQSVTDAQRDLNKSQAAAIGTVQLKSGSMTLGQINATGTKSLYRVGTSSIKRMKTSAINLVNVMGVFTASEAKDFALGSDSFKVIKNALLDKAQSNVSFKMQYRSDLYLLNYPTWNGQEITHDPTFTINYDAPPPPSEDDSGPNVILPTPTFTFTLVPTPEEQQLQSTTNSIVNVKELPTGFALTTFTVSIIGMVLALILSRGRKRIYI